MDAFQVLVSLGKLPETPRVTWTELIGNELHVEDLMAEVDEALKTKLHDVPTLTIFGARNAPFDWQGRYERTLANTTAVVIDKGNHFPSMDDPEKFAGSFKAWWAQVMT